MTVLSSASTPFLRQTLPRFIYGGLAIVSVLLLLTAIAESDPWLLGFPAAAGLFAIVLVRQRLTVLADEVRDCGDALLVRRDAVEAHVTFSSIERVGLVPRTEHVCIRLANPSPFGHEVTFAARRGQSRAIRDDLARRAAKAHSA